jgi:hypothetical protein
VYDGGRYPASKLENLILFNGNCDEGDLFLRVGGKTYEDSVPYLPVVV